MNAVIQSSPSKLDAVVFLESEIVINIQSWSNLDAQKSGNARPSTNWIVTKRRITDTLLHEVARRGNLNQLNRSLQNWWKRFLKWKEFSKKRMEKVKPRFLWAREGAGVLPYSHIGMFRLIGYGFGAVLVWKRVYTLPILVWNRVWFSRELRSLWTYLSFQF